MPRLSLLAAVLLIQPQRTVLPAYHLLAKGGVHTIISRKKLLEASGEHGSLGGLLDSWYRTAKSGNWNSLQEVRQTYQSADSVGVGEKAFTVFNVGGNNFRLIVETNYRSQRIFVRHVLTHAEYDKGNWKK